MTHLLKSLTAAPAFLVMQIVLLAGGAAATTSRLRELQAERQMPAPRTQPLTVLPQYDDPRVIADEQLTAVLTKLRPRLRGKEPKINNVDHALRMWGVEARFDDPQCLSGEEMRALLLSDARFRAAWGEKTPSLLADTPQGIAVRTQEGHATASHVDHTLAGLAEVGTPIDFPVQTSGGRRSVRDLLGRAWQRFSLNQIEYEWSALAFALYLPARQWRSTEGQEITYARLAERIQRQPLSQGVCAGNHRLHALVMLLRIDDQFDLLTDAEREPILAHLRDATARLVRHQHALGFWDRNWPTAEPAEGDVRAGQPFTDHILATGHALEWWALAPEDVHPPREVVIRAAQWLTRTIEEMTPEQIEAQYTFLTHAGRALALWRGHFPSHFVAPAAKPVTEKAP